MIITKYGLRLTRINGTHLEELRQHRNSDFIKSKMFFQDHISLENQLIWFQKINNYTSYYFMVSYEGRNIGMVNGSIISLKAKTTKGGIFFWDNVALNSFLPVKVAVLMGDFTFLLFEMNATHAEVRSDNKAAIQFNKNLGYAVSSQECNKLRLVLKKQDFLKSKAKRLVQIISKNENDLKWDDIILTAQDIKNKEQLFREITTKV